MIKRIDKHNTTAEWIIEKEYEIVEKIQEYSQSKSQLLYENQKDYEKSELGLYQFYKEYYNQ